MYIDKYIHIYEQKNIFEKLKECFRIHVHKILLYLKLRQRKARSRNPYLHHLARKTVKIAFKVKKILNPVVMQH